MLEKQGIGNDLYTHTIKIQTVQQRPKNTSLWLKRQKLWNKTKNTDKSVHGKE